MRPGLPFRSLIREQIPDNAPIGLMIYTAAAVVVTDFLTGVMTAVVIYAIGYWIGRKTCASSKARLCRF